jgi:hypothetical protein
LILLTATPHSGDEAAFARLLSLLDPGFAEGALEGEQNRERLARHFVQRRRIDITAVGWGEERVFPRHETKEHPYALSKAHRAFHDAVLDYCLGVVEGAGPEQHRRRLAFWGTLALMRCVGSSRAAAASALRNRLAADPERLVEQVFDEDDDEGDAVDIEPTAGLEQEGPLAELVNQAESLAKAADPKLDVLVKLLAPLIDEGANPVVFCRFIATADHVALGLRKAFPKLRIEAVTGDLPSDDRRMIVSAMAANEQRLLVATDCLSEGINLQSLFDTVVHYDLSWNPTRHQQREGRVDRFGQPAKLVRSVLLYSPDSAIDGAVLEVILRKAEQIRKATGVTVPLPDERGAVTGALMNAVLLRKGTSRQLVLDFGSDPQAMETRWRDAEEGEKRSRAIFAQNAMRPQEVMPEWQRWRDLLGSPEQVRRFVERAMSRLDAALEPDKSSAVRAHVDALPAAVKERLAARGLEGTIRISFNEPPPAGAEMVARSHPLPATLADMLLEGALDPTLSSLPTLGRAGAWPTAIVKTATTVVLLRLRYKLTVRGRKERMLLAEEAAIFACDAGQPRTILTGEAARALLEHSAAADLAPVARQRLITKAVEQIGALLGGPIAAYAGERTKALSEDHARVRAAATGSTRVSVDAVLPADVIGLYVLLPAER